MRIDRWQLSPVTAAILAVAAASCIGPRAPHFVQPPVGQPHALVEVRATYYSDPGTQLAQAVFINGYNVGMAAEGDSVRVPLSPLQWQVSTQFSHDEPYSARESYWEQQAYTTSEPHTVRDPYTAYESYSCGGYSNGSYSSRTCSRPVTRYRTRTEYRTVTKYRQVQRYRTVTRYRSVVDASCDAAIDQQPRQGASYLLQYEYYEHGRCSVQCFEKVRQSPSDAAPTLVSCEAASQAPGA